MTKKKVNVKPAQYQLVCGDAAHMDIIRSGEVDLVLTGPPYFSPKTEPLLQKPAAEQNQPERVRREITDYALTLQPVYVEMERILKPDGVLVIQIKDIRYQHFLITRIYWHKKSLRSRALKFRDKPFVGAFRADDVEDILIFSRSNIPKQKDLTVNLKEQEIEKCWRSPLWDMAPAGKNRRHPHQAPKTSIRRIIALYSKPMDLVVDPFAGGGTTLKIALEMNRRAIGYEIIDHRAEAADAAAEKTLNKMEQQDLWHINQI